MGFADRYIASLSASNLRDDADHHQAEPLTASAFAAAELSGDLGPLLYRVKYAGTAQQTLAHSAVMRARAERELADAIRVNDVHREAECRQALEGDTTAAQMSTGELAQLLRLWIAEVIKRGRARKWVPENTEWDAASAQKLYRTVAEASLAHWLDSTCKCCNGTGVIHRQQCKPCGGKGEAAIEGKGGFVLERTKDMVGELHNIVITHASRAAAKLR